MKNWLKSWLTGTPLGILLGFGGSPSTGEGPLRIKGPSPLFIWLKRWRGR